MAARDSPDLLQTEISQVEHGIDTLGQHGAQARFAFATRGWARQGQQAFKGIATAFGMSGGQATMPGIGCLDEFQRLIANDFPDTVGVQRHGQAICDQVAQRDRQSAFVPLADPVDQAIGFFRIDFAVAFCDKHPFQKRHGLDHGAQQGGFA